MAGHVPVCWVVGDSIVLSFPAREVDVVLHVVLWVYRRGVYHGQGRCVHRAPEWHPHLRAERGLDACCMSMLVLEGSDCAYLDDGKGRFLEALCLIWQQRLAACDARGCGVVCSSMPISPGSAGSLQTLIG